MKIFTLATLLGSFVLLTGCETTGDPRSGGIFWSERKAQERLYDKREQLREVEQDTERVQSRSQQTKRRIEDEG